MSPTYSFVLQLLRGEAGAKDTLATGEVDWEVFEASTRTFRPYIDRCLRRAGLSAALPQDVAHRLEEGVRLETLLHVRRGPMLRSILKALHGIGLEPIVLKGGALAHTAYPSPELRPMADLDFWLDGEELDRAVEALGELGYAEPYRHTIRPKVPDTRVLELGNTPIFVELHSEPEPLGAVLRSEAIEAIRSRSVKAVLGGAEARIMAAEDLLVNVALHAAVHHEFDLGLRPILDLSLLIDRQRESIEWEALAARYRGTEMEVWLDLMLGVTREIFRTEIPPEAFGRPPGPTPEVVGVAAELALAHRRGSRPTFIAQLLNGTTWTDRVRAIARRSAEQYTGDGFTPGARQLAFDVFVKSPRHLSLMARGYYSSRELESRRIQVDGWERLRDLVRSEAPMKISVVTPSRNQSEWLRLCVASVADQGVDVEHLVHDSMSTDGTSDWLSDDARVDAVIEPDSGMYEAVNRGLSRAKGEILAYLNCDEQYLPGTLRRVEHFMAANPEIDVLFGDVVVVDQECEYLFHRKMLTPTRLHTWLCQLSTLTCGMFFRRRVIHEWGVLFDDTCPVADAEWVLRLIERGAVMATLGEWTSVFGATGENLSVSIAEDDGTSLTGHRPTPRWMRTLRPAVIAQHRLRRLVRGAYRMERFRFELFTPESGGARVARTVDRPDFRWTSW